MSDELGFFTPDMIEATKPNDDGVFVITLTTEIETSTQLSITARSLPVTIEKSRLDEESEFPISSNRESISSG
jgi:hypothetical protein